MDKTLFSEWITGIYANFGRAKPAAEIMRAIYSRVDELPDDFFRFAGERIIDFDDLPKNFGKLLKTTLWPEYLSAHPELRSYADYCPDCGGSGFIVRRLDVGRPGYGPDKSFECLCRAGSDKGWTRERMDAAGYTAEKVDPSTIGRAKSALARLGVHLGDISDSRADQRVGHLPDVERGEVLAW